MGVSPGHRALLALVVAIVLITLSALAWASPGDPTWIPGIYDNGDFDDAILAVLSIDGLTITITVAVASLAIGPALPFVRQQLRASPSFDVALSRAPPSRG